MVNDLAGLARIVPWLVVLGLATLVLGAVLDRLRAEVVT